MLKPLRYIFQNLEQKLNSLTFLQQRKSILFSVGKSHGQSKSAEQLLTL